MGVSTTAQLARARGGERVLAAGLVTTRQQPSTAKGTVFLLLEDAHGTVNVIVAPAVVERDREAVRHGQFALVDGRAERDGPLVNVVARRVAAFGPDVLRGRSSGGALRAPATTPAGRGPTTRIAPPERDLAYRSHDFR